MFDDLRRAVQHSRSATSATARWDRQRHWYLPRVHAVWAGAASGPRPLLACLHSDLGRPALAGLRQHRVAGRALLPGAAMFEACHAAAAALLGAAPPTHEPLSSFVHTRI